MTSHTKDRIRFALNRPPLRDVTKVLADQPNRIAFSDLLVRLANDPPPTIIGEADAEDLEQYAEHMQKLLENVEHYVADVLADMQHRVSGVNLYVNVLGILSDTRGDIVGTLKIAAEQKRELECEFEDED
jgi:hypothetical protein